MQQPPARIGDTLDQIDTPALVLDLDAFERNLRKMAEFARKAGVRLRPHAKTHKSTAVALRQMALGAVGQCCQKIGEAEALVRGGVRDVLVTNEVVSESKLRRLASLAADATIGLCFDAAEPVALASRVAKEMGVRLDALVEIEVGMQRCGVAPGAPAAALARRITESPGLRFRGLQAYHGSAQHLATYREREQAIAGAADAVRTTLDALKQAGVPCEIVTGAGTGTYSIEAASGLWQELQAGSYAFMDADYARIGGKQGGRFADFEHSLFVLVSVMSVTAGERAVVDAGLKSYSMEKGPPWVHGRSDLEVIGVSDEHGKIRAKPGGALPALGERLLLIPGHCDPTINLHDWYVGIRRGRVEALWPINARGASS
ncbi:MAG TPA: DSD1 family PLP-dependent enzyme [Alphaproteobacteria bacterium]|nr:DSD1 family PLP-dependent enzyme [Alphaproteobacteria bacterium]